MATTPLDACPISIFTSLLLPPIPPPSISIALLTPTTSMASQTNQEQRLQQQSALSTEIPAPRAKSRFPGGPTVLRLGKRAVIVGAAVTSAPFVIPPLLVFSALGLAFAFPFGLLFAGVACTDKLMRSLLTQPESSPSRGHGEGDADDKGESGSSISSSYEYESAVDDQLSDAESKWAGAPPAPANEKGFYVEKKIWEQIFAIRAIVGYGTPPRSSYVEELRELYVFTGVEPPFSVKDPSDSVEINEKVQWLKSLVGIQ